MANLLGNNKTDKDLINQGNAGRFFGSEKIPASFITPEQESKIRGVTMPEIKTVSRVLPRRDTKLQELEFGLEDSKPRIDMSKLQDTGFDFKQEKQQLFTQEDLPKVRELLDEGFTIEEIKQAKMEMMGIEVPKKQIEDIKETPEEKEDKGFKFTSPAEAITSIPKAIGTIGKGIKSTVGGVIESAGETFEGLAKIGQKKTLDLANVIRKKLGKPELTIEEASKSGLDPIGGLQSTVQEDLLDIGQGSLQLGLTATFPVATLGFTTAGQTEEGEKVLQAIGGAIQVGGKYINKIPGLSDFRESLPEERRPDFDAFVGQAVTLGLFKAGSKLSEIKAKWEQANALVKQSETAGKVLRPTKTEVKTSLESAEKGLTRIAKETNKDVKDFSGLKDSIKPIKDKAYKPLKEGLDDAQVKLNKIEANKPFKGNTQDPSVTTALNQLADVLEGLGSKENIALRTEVLNLIKKNQTKGLNLNEIQYVKQLHTENNSLFTDKGQIKGKTVSQNDLRGIRKDIKELIEKRAEEGGFTDVKKLNTEYGEILSAEQLIKERVAEAKSAKLKIEEPGIVGKTMEFLLNLPVIKQTFTAGGQAIFNRFARSVIEKKLSITELEAQLPKLLKELRNSGESSSNISKLTKLLKDNFPALVITSE